MKNDELIVALKILVKSFNNISRLEFKQDEYLLFSCFKVINQLTAKSNISYCHLGSRVVNSIEAEFGKLSDLTDEQIIRIKLGYLRGFMQKFEHFNLEKYRINIEDFDPIIIMIESQTNLIVQDWITSNDVVRFFDTNIIFQQLIDRGMIEKIDKPAGKSAESEIIEIGEKPHVTTLI